MKVIIDRDKCVSSGACVVASPEVFIQDEDGVVELLTDEPAPELEFKLREAAATCPAMVIRIEP